MRQTASVINNARPVWLLDVDGVLNAPRPRWGAAIHRGYASAHGMSFEMRWSPQLIARIRQLHEAGDVEIRWSSTWVDHIQQLQRMFDLPRFPIAFSALDEQECVSDLKLQAAKDVVCREQRPLIWTDDEAIEHIGHHCPQLTEAMLPTLLLSPNPRIGLRPTDMTAIEDFVASLATTEPTVTLPQPEPALVS